MRLSAARGPPGNFDTPGDFPIHGARAYLLHGAAWLLLHARERRLVGSRLRLRRILARANISCRGR